MGFVEKSVVRDKEYLLVPPDGGWGYVICVAATIVFVALTGLIPCFGLLYDDLFEELGLASTQATLANGIGAVFVALSGLLTDIMLKSMSRRMLCLICAVIYTTGVFLIAFVQSELLFYICFGVLQGIGFGALFNCTFELLNAYFEEKRLFAISIVQTLTAFLVMFLPKFIQYCRSTYGSRGTIIIATGISIQVFIGVALMQPVEWHMKKVPKKIPTGDLQVLLNVDESGDKIPIVKLSEIESMTDDKEKAQEIDQNNLKLNQTENTKSFLDVALIKLLLTTNVSWGIAWTTFADITHSIMLPQALSSYGWEEDRIALAITLTAFGDLAGRGFFIVFSRWIKMGNQELYNVGSVISAMSVIGLLLSPNVTVALIFITIKGFSRCFVPLFVTLVISEAVGVEKLLTAMGYIMVPMSIMNLGLGPVIGAIRDYTGSYNVVFWIVSGVTLASSISWYLEVVYKRKKSKKVNL